MAERVFTTLGHWVDARRRRARRGDPRGRHSRIPTPRLRKSARKLFACALETPGGLKVQTIHALCTRLLQQFPFEANVPARFAVLDDRDQNEMMERANLGGVPRGVAQSRKRDGPRADDGDGERRRRHLQGCGARSLPQPRSFHGVDGRRRQRAGRRRADFRGARRRPRRSHRGRRARDRRRTATCRDRDGRKSPLVLDTGSKTDQDQAARLRDALVFTGAAQVDEYLGVFLTEADRTPRKSVVTKKFCDNNPAIGRLFESEAGRIASPDRTPPRGDRRATAPRRCCISRPPPRPITGARSRNAACSTMTI